MIKFDNKTISSIFYSGHSISRIMGCDGHLVWSGGTTPTGDKVRVWYSENPYGETEYAYACDGNPILLESDHMLGEDDRFDAYITDAVIGTCATIIGELCFYKCHSLSSVTIPTSVTTIQTQAFYDCPSLTSITIPNSVTNIDYQAFSECGLLECTIPDSVTSIGSGLLYGSSAMTSCTIGNGVTSIPNNTFYDCKGLQTIVIGSGVTSLGESAFSVGSSRNLQSITFLSPTPPSAPYASTFYSNGSYVIYVPSESVDLYKNSSDTGWHQVKDRIQAIP